MLKALRLAVATLAIPTLAGCGILPISSLSSAKSGAPVTAQAASFGSSTVVQDTHLGGSRFASFNVMTDRPAYGTQAIVHRYVASDVAYYVLTLDDMTQGASGTEVAQIQVNPGQAAAFTHLRINTLYKVSAAAYSDVQTDGATASQAVQVNANDTTNYSEFNFTSGSSSNNNIDNQINYCSANFYNALVVHLDNSAFDGTATLGTTGASFSVYDGQYTASTQPITATAQDGSTCNCSSSSDSSGSDSGSGSSKNGSKDGSDN